MLLTKELVAKGSAILGSAGAGGTGLYYGGNYMASVHKGSALLKVAEQHKDKHILFAVERDGKGFDQVFVVADGENKGWYGPKLDFENNQKSFVVKIASKSLTDTANGMDNRGTQTLDAAINVQCSLKFEIEGNTGNKTIKQDYKDRIFWLKDGTSQKLGLLGVLQYPSQGYTDDAEDTQHTKFTKQEIGDIKRKFAENCGQWNTQKNSSEVPIRFKAEGSELVPSDVEFFDKWFLSAVDAKKYFHDLNFGESSSG